MNRILLLLGRLVARPFTLLVFGLSLLMPRSPRTWVFGSWKGERFADNSKAVFLHVAASRPHVRPVWITRDQRIAKHLRARGLESYHAFSPRGLWCCLRAGVYIYDSYLNDINFWTSGGAFRVNLWHGVPLKKIERDIDTPAHNYHKGFYGPSWYRFAFWIWGPWVKSHADMMIATSAEIQRIMAHAFGIDAQRVDVTGLPRNDMLKPSRGNSDDEWLARVGRLKQGGARVFAYLPTFRDIPAELPIDWTDLETFLASTNSYFILKMHSHSKAILPDFSHSRRILQAPASTDVYPFLSEADVLVTDYSSIYVDFMLTGKPIIFYAYDLPEYRAEMRSMYFPYEAVTPGPKVATYEDLKKALNSLGDSHPTYKEVMKRFHEATGFDSSERVVAAVERRLSAHR